MTHADHFATYRRGIQRLHRRRWSWTRPRLVYRRGDTLPGAVPRAWKELPIKLEAGAHQ